MGILYVPPVILFFSYQILVEFLIVELDFQADLIPFEVESFHFEEIGAQQEPKILREKN